MNGGYRMMNFLTEVINSLPGPIKMCNAVCIHMEGVAVQTLDEDKTDEVVRKNDTITLEINSITEEYHRFFHEMLAETRQSNPLFSGSPANMSTNIETKGGTDVVGFFAVYSVLQRFSQSPQRLTI